MHRDGIGREFQDAVWEMALETLGEGKSRTLSQPCASSSSLPLITNMSWHESHNHWDIKTKIVFRSSTVSCLAVTVHLFFSSHFPSSMFYESHTWLQQQLDVRRESWAEELCKLCVYLWISENHRYYTWFVWLKKLRAHKMIINKL